MAEDRFTLDQILLGYVVGGGVAPAVALLDPEDQAAYRTLNSPGAEAALAYVIKSAKHKESLAAECDRLEIAGALDSLTELPTRAACNRDLEKAVARVTSGKYGGDTDSSDHRAKISYGDVTLLVVDIDKFKDVNDTYGHGKGDEVIIAVAKALSETLREYDTLYRVGGDELYVILEQTDAQDGAAAAERLREAVETKCSAEALGMEWGVTVSIGGSNYRALCDSITELKELADKALYQAKREGRNGVAMMRSSQYIPEPNGSK
jgi:diguanylate cyclase (GGDEF)-like protein